MNLVNFVADGRREHVHVPEILLVFLKNERDSRFWGVLRTLLPRSVEVHYVHQVHLFMDSRRGAPSAKAVRSSTSAIAQTRRCCAFSRTLH